MTIAAYYNEHEPFAAQWLRNLIAGGFIAPGHIDDRSIEDVRPDDLRGFTQCHFFAGIAGWSLALRLAGWPDDRPVWTGSCPCQPFSAAGKGEAFEDERHLWPVWFELIRAIRPSVALGEQVDAAIGWGCLDLIHDDMEAEGYTVRSAVLPACGVGAPHIRDRLWFMAYASSQLGEWDRQRTGRNSEPADDGELGDAIGPRLAGRPSERRDDEPQCASAERTGGEFCAVVDSAGEQMGFPGRSWFARNANPWSDLEWLPCTDGKARPTRPGLFPLAHGVPARVGKLRAAGNAIVPQVAAEFIKAVMQSPSPGGE